MSFALSGRFPTLFLISPILSAQSVKWYDFWVTDCSLWYHSQSSHTSALPLLVNNRHVSPFIHLQSSTSDTVSMANCPYCFIKVCCNRETGPLCGQLLKVSRSVNALYPSNLKSWLEGFSCFHKPKHHQTLTLENLDKCKVTEVHRLLGHQLLGNF